MAKFSVVRVDRHLASQFLDDVGTAPVFSHPEVLEVLAPHVDWWLALRGEEPTCLWPVPLNEDGIPATPPFSYYVGPTWSQKALKRAPSHVRASIHAVYEGLIDILLQNYDTLHFELTSDQMDVRPFMWWNYHDSPENRFKVEPRYSAVISDLQLRSDQDLLMNMRSVRRREISRLLDAPILRREVEDPAILQDSYSELMCSQGVDVPSSVLKIIERLWQLARGGWGWAHQWTLLGHEGAASTSIVLRDRHVGHLVLKLGNHTDLVTGLPALAVFDAIRICRESGLRSFDFNGANSPARGDDKHSFGAAAQLYFRLAFPGHES